MYSYVNQVNFYKRENINICKCKGHGIQREHYLTNDKILDLLVDTYQYN